MHWWTRCWKIASCKAAGRQTSRNKCMGKLPSHWPSRERATCSRPTRPWLRASTASPRLSRTISRSVRPRKTWHHRPRFAGPGPPDPKRLVREFQHGLFGDPRERGGQRRESLARRSEPAPVGAAVSTLAARRSTDQTRDQRSPHAELGFVVGRRSLDEGVWKGPLAGDDGYSRARHSPGSRHGPLATAHGRSRSFVEYVRQCVSRQLAGSGASPEAVDRCEASI